METFVWSGQVRAAGRGDSDSRNEVFTELKDFIKKSFLDKQLLMNAIRY